MSQATLIQYLKQGKTVSIKPAGGVGPWRKVSPPAETWPVCPQTDCHHGWLSTSDPAYQEVEDGDGSKCRALAIENCHRNKCYRVTGVMNPCLRALHGRCGQPQKCLCPCHFPGE